jgi:hypothetical protein
MMTVAREQNSRPSGSIGTGGESEQVSELAGERTLVVEPAGGCDVTDGGIGRADEVHGMLDALPLDEAAR